MKYMILVACFVFCGLAKADVSTRGEIMSRSADFDQRLKNINWNTFSCVGDGSCTLQVNGETCIAAISRSTHAPTFETGCDGTYAVADFDVVSCSSKTVRLPRSRAAIQESMAYLTQVACGR